jgi:hypothetical protein
VEGQQQGRFYFSDSVFHTYPVSPPSGETRGEKRRGLARITTDLHLAIAHSTQAIYIWLSEPAYPSLRMLEPHKARDEDEISTAGFISLRDKYLLGLLAHTALLA